jgi:two-component system chemotaxis response regulator CheB
MGGGVVRVAICEDSPTYAAALTRFLQRDPDFEVVATYSRCEDLIRGLPAARADIVTMDIELAGRDGLYGTKLIMSRRPTPIVVVSAHTGPGSERVVAALAAGALDVIDKRTLRLGDSAGPSAVAVRGRIKYLARTGVAQLRPPSWRSPASQRSLRARRATVVGIAASTGGPAALAGVLAKLSAQFPLPVLVVQHISTGFTEGLVAWLDSVVALPVGLARDGERVARGVWVAPEGAHLRLAPGGLLSLDASGDASGHRPSGDVLLTSLADSAHAGAVSIVLTGMGRDGAEGTAAVCAAGGLTIAQDEASSIVYGMPRAALERGAELILSPSAIADALGELRTAREAR